LVVSGEEDEARQRHALYVLALAEQADRELRGPQHGPWLDRLATESGNVRAAMAWLLERGQAETGLRLTEALRNFVMLRGYPGEARLWQERLLAAGTDLPPDVRATANSIAGEWAMLTGDYQMGARRLEEGLQLARRIGDQRLIAVALYRFASFASTAGGLDELGGAEALAEEALTRFRAIDDAQEVAGTLALLGQLAQ
jgi:hypothetical protein